MKKKFALIVTACLMIAVMVLLAGCGGKGGSASGAQGDQGDTANQVEAYLVIVTDEDNAPIEGVKLQLCRDEVCNMATTDATGVATFEVEKDDYTLHVLTAPDGYQVDTTEYEVSGDYGITTIVLKK